MAAATIIPVTEGRATRVTMGLAHDGRIEGRLLADAGSVSYIELSVFQDGLPLCPNGQYVDLAPFSIRGLGNGDYTLAAFVNGMPWWYPGTAMSDSARVLRIRNHETVRGIVWRLPSPGERNSP
jgi:hypothetical protein